MVRDIELATFSYCFYVENKTWVKFKSFLIGIRIECLNACRSVSIGFAKQKSIVWNESTKQSVFNFNLQVVFHIQKQRINKCRLLSQLRRSTFGALNIRIKENKTIAFCRLTGICKRVFQCKFPDFNAIYIREKKQAIKKLFCQNYLLNSNFIDVHKIL